MKLKKLLKISIMAVVGLLVLAAAAIGMAYLRQDRLVAEAVQQLNSTFNGRFAIEGSHISPFENFPYVSIDLDHVQVYQHKDTAQAAAIDVAHVYVGFNLWSIITGGFEVKKIKLSNGTMHIIQQPDGSLNLANAFASPQQQPAPKAEPETEPETISSNPALSLKLIELENIDILKVNGSNNILSELLIERLTSSFAMTESHIKASLNTQMLFNLIIHGDTSFLHDKHLTLSTGIDYDLNSGLLTLTPSELLIETASFLMEGSIDMANDMHLNLQFSGQKPNFDLFLAFAPPEMAPVFARYDNGGRVYFNASLTGPAYGVLPHIEVDFGCEEAFVENTQVAKAVDELYFKGHFTNGAKNHPSTMALVIEDFTARPETGTFKGAITVKNFEAPEIDMQVNSNFNLAFLSQFLNIERLQNVSGNVLLNMNFHDIIDLDDPSKAIEQLNESYYTELKVQNLSFTSTDFHLPVSNINIQAAMDGHKAVVNQFTAKIGSSDIALTAAISDLPAIIHHTNLPVTVDLDIQAGLIDLLELTQTDSLAKGFNEQIKDLSLGFKFNSSARAFTESPYLPLGEFFVTRHNAQLTNYPHKLHDFNADIIIDSTDFKVIDFAGMIDQSDFHFNGSLNHYELWFVPNPTGASTIDFNLDARQLKLANLFNYGGENYVPEDYRTEVFNNLKFHGLTTLQFNNKLTAVQLAIDQLGATMQQHGITFNGLAGHVAVDSTQLVVTNFGGKVGRSEFTTNLTYYLKADSTTAPHTFALNSPRLDFDQLFSYLPPQPDATTGQVDHEAGFNVFDLPFSNINFTVDIAQMNYHRYLLNNFTLQGRMQTNHTIYVDTLALQAAGGTMQLNGYFNGANPNLIYFSPNMALSTIDLDQLLFKFDNFGQDQLVSDNLQGQLSGTLTGKIHMHPDLVPAIDDSELTMAIEVLNGSLNNFAAFSAMTDYFTDKNLNNVRFDTLKNTLQLKNGALTIPNMNLNTSLGYFEIAGTQGVDLTMDYTMRIPLKVIARAGMQRLFGKKDRDTSNQVDDIQYRDQSKRTRFVTVNIAGTPDDYKVSLGKNKKRKD